MIDTLQGNLWCVLPATVRSLAWCRRWAHTAVIEMFPLQSSSWNDDTRLDILARSFWGGRFEKTYFDVRCLTQTPPLYLSFGIAACYRRQEEEENRKCKEIEKSRKSFFHTTRTFLHWGYEQTYHNFHQKLSSMLAEAKDMLYSNVINWLRCRLRFELARTSIMCSRGNRSKRFARPENNLLLATAEWHMATSAQWL